MFAISLIHRINEFLTLEPQVKAALKQIDDIEDLYKMGSNKSREVLAQRFPKLSKEDLLVLNQEVRHKHIAKEVKDTPLDQLKASMQSGNKKLSDKVKTFNLPAIRSCPNSKQCEKDCYAKKADIQYPSAAKSRETNFRLARESRDQLKQLIQKELKKGDIVRIHESGDFFSQAYLDMWNEIVAANPDVLFYAYTKTEDKFNFSAIKKHKNFNLVSSMIKGEKNFGPEEEINIKASEMKLPICPCKKGNAVKCGEDCKICMTKGQENVLFVQH